MVGVLALETVLEFSDSLLHIVKNLSCELSVKQNGRYKIKELDEAASCLCFRFAFLKTGHKVSSLLRHVTSQQALNFKLCLMQLSDQTTSQKYTDVIRKGGAINLKKMEDFPVICT